MRARRYVLLTATPLALAALALAIVATDRDAAPLAAAAAFLLAVPGVTFLVFLHRMWSAIRDQHTKPSPARAVALVLVPVVNLFWLPRAIARWPAQAERFAERNGHAEIRVGRGPFVAFVALVYVVPSLVLAAAFFLEQSRSLRVTAELMLVAAAALAIVEVALLFVIMLRVCRTVNALSRGRAQARRS